MSGMSKKGKGLDSMEIPIENLMRTGTASVTDFKRVGEAISNRLCDLLEDVQVPLGNVRLLDFGCGVGRITDPLTHKLDDESLIYACDVDKENVSYIRSSRKIIPLVTHATPPLPF